MVVGFFQYTDGEKDGMAEAQGTENQIRVTVKLFAAYQEAYGVSELALEFPIGTTVRGVCDRLLAEHPELEVWRNLTRFGVNLQFVEPDTVLETGDEVVLIPPVSGG
jgi:sulfur-carrier protein